MGSLVSCYRPLERPSVVRLEIEDAAPQYFSGRQQYLGGPYKRIYFFNL